MIISKYEQIIQRNEFLCPRFHEKYWTTLFSFASSVFFTSDWLRGTPSLGTTTGVPP